MTYVESIRNALAESNATIFGQHVYTGEAGLTTGIPKERMVQFPVAEALMNSAAFGYALAGQPVVVIHDRMDFLVVGMDALVNWIPVWLKISGLRLPVTILSVVGKGHGQGPQHSKDLSSWFELLDGWVIRDPQSPKEAYQTMKRSIDYKKPVCYVARRELWNSTGIQCVNHRSRIGICGASAGHEKAFYG